MSPTADSIVTEVHEIPLAEIFEAPWNPRKHFDDAKLRELAASIREKGVIEPAIVRTRVTAECRRSAAARDVDSSGGQ